MTIHPIEATATFRECLKRVQPFQPSYPVLSPQKSRRFEEVFYKKKPPTSATATLSKRVLIEEFVGQNPYLHPLYQQHRQQLEDLGVEFAPHQMKMDLNEVAPRFNSQMEDLIDRGVISREQGVFWARVYVDKMGYLEFVRWGQKASHGSRLFDPRKFEVVEGDPENNLERIRYSSGLLTTATLSLSSAFLPERNSFPSGPQNYFRSQPFFTNSDFTHALGLPDGSMIPITESTFFAGDFIGSPIFTTFLSHDLSHLIGLLNHPEMIRFYINAQKQISQAPRQDQLLLSEQFKGLNEYLILVDPLVRSEIDKVLRNFGFSDAEAILADKGSSLNELEEIAMALFVRSIPLIYRLGGAARTPGMGFLRPLSAFDRAYLNLATIPELDLHPDETKVRLRTGIYQMVQALILGSSITWDDVWAHFLGEITLGTQRLVEFHR